MPQIQPVCWRVPITITIIIIIIIITTTTTTTTTIIIIIIIMKAKGHKQTTLDIHIHCCIHISHCFIIGGTLVDMNAVAC